VAPVAPLSLNPSVYNPAVAHLQFLLNMVLLRYDVAHQMTPGGPPGHRRRVWIGDRRGGGGFPSGLWCANDHSGGL
jgi:hypothetical protein